MYMLIHRSVTSQSDVYTAQHFQVDCNALLTQHIHVYPPPPTLVILIHAHHRKMHKTLDFLSETNNSHFQGKWPFKSVWMCGDIVCIWRQFHSHVDCHTCTCLVHDQNAVHILTYSSSLQLSMVQVVRKSKYSCKLSTVSFLGRNVYVLAKGGL